MPIRPLNHLTHHFQLFFKRIPMPNSSILAFFQLEFSFMELLGEFFVDDGESVEFFGDGGEVARKGGRKMVEKNLFFGSKMAQKATNPILSMSFL